MSLIKSASALKSPLEAARAHAVNVYNPKNGCYAIGYATQKTTLAKKDRAAAEKTLSALASLFGE